jgi:hypothetical protein
MSNSKRVKIIVPDERTVAARQRAEDERALWTTIESIRYDSTNRQFRLVMQSGVTLSIPRSHIDELDEVDNDALKDVQVGGGGDVIEFSDLGIHISAPGLFRDIFGLNVGQRNGGRSRSTAKIAAARVNGAAGGRPAKARTKSR